MSRSAATSSKLRTRRVRLVSLTASATRLWHEHLAERLEVLDALAGAEHDRVERIVDKMDRHTGLLAHPRVEALEQGTAAGQRDSAVHDVAGQFRRALVEGGLDRVDDGVDRLLDRSPDLLGGDDDGLGQAADQVTAPYLGVRLLTGPGERRTDRHLDLFCGALPQHQGVLLLGEGDDGLVEFVA